MNKKEVSMFLTAITGRLLCTRWSDFFKWAEERLDRHILLEDPITDAEWREIADFFIETGEVIKE